MTAKDLVLAKWSLVVVHFKEAGAYFFGGGNKVDSLQPRQWLPLSVMILNESNVLSGDVD